MKRSVCILLIIFLTVPLFSQVYQWRGPKRDGIFEETELLKEWPEGGPELVLEVEGIGKGWSSPVVTADRIFISGMKDSADYLSCIDFEGNIIWQKSYGSSWAKSFPDTRGSATIEDNRVYILSGQGNLICFEYSDGDIIWELDVDKTFGSEWHSWGVSESILIVDDKVICSPGGNETSIVALDKMTGELIWKSESDGGLRAYTSPTIYQYKDQRYILATTGTNLMALDPESGEVAWKYTYFDASVWKWQPGLIWVNTPVFQDNKIWISKGYDYPSVMLTMDTLGSSVSESYVDHTFDNHHHGQILIDGHLYGSNWISNGKGKWVCMKWETGEITWIHDWESKGSIIYADGLFYLYEEKKGNVALVKPDKNKFDLISSFKVEKGTGPHWAHPYIAHGKLFLRHGDYMAAYSIAN